MADQLQLRGGTTSQVQAFTGAEREVVVDTTKNALVVQDGTTQGGFYVASADELADVNGSALVGWKRSPLIDYSDTVHKALDGSVVNIWESSYLITSKPVPSDPNTWDWTPAYQRVFDLGLKFSAPRMNYNFTNLTLRAGVIGDGGSVRGTNVLALATPETFKGAVLTQLAVTGTAIRFPNTAFGAALVGFAFDLRNQISGDGIVFDDDVLTQRTGQLLEHCLVYMSSGHNVWIKSNSKEVRLIDVFARGGPDIDNARSLYGIRSSSQDCVTQDCWAAFNKTRNFLEEGIGANRHFSHDAFGCQDWSVEISGSGSSMFHELQSDTSRGGALLVSGDATPLVENLRAVNNRANVVGLTALPGPEVFVTGNAIARFINPKLSGPAVSANMTYGFDTDTLNLSNIDEGAVASSGYTLGPVSPAVRAAWRINNVEGFKSPLYGLTRGKKQVNPNVIMWPVIGGVLNGWAMANGAVPTHLASGIPYSYPGATALTSGAVAAAAATCDLTADLPSMLGKRIGIHAFVRGDGTTFLGNQRLEIRFGTSTQFIAVQNNGVFTDHPLDVFIPLDATTCIVRLTASNAAVPGLVLGVSQITVDIY